MKTSRIAILTAAALVATAGVALAESVWVKSDSANVLQGKGAVYPVVGTVKKGQELVVLSRDGKWIEVQSGPNRGWVYETAISPQKVDTGGFTLSASPVGFDTAAASRGWTEDTNQYAAGKNLDKRPLQHLVDLKKSIAATEWETFNRDVKNGAK